MCHLRQKLWIDVAAYGRVEVLREAQAEQQRAADGDVGVAAEVGVDLDGVAVDAEQDLEVRVLARVGEHRLDDRARHEARDHDLLEQSGEDQPEGQRGSDVAGIRPSR